MPSRTPPPFAADTPDGAEAPLYLNPPYGTLRAGCFENGLISISREDSELSVAPEEAPHAQLDVEALIPACDPEQEFKKLLVVKDVYHLLKTLKASTGMPVRQMRKIMASPGDPETRSPFPAPRFDGSFAATCPFSVEQLAFLARLSHAMNGRQFTDGAADNSIYLVEGAAMLAVMRQSSRRIALGQRLRRKGFLDARFRPIAAREAAMRKLRSFAEYDLLCDEERSSIRYSLQSVCGITAASVAYLHIPDYVPDLCWSVILCPAGAAPGFFPEDTAVVVVRGSFLWFDWAVDALARTVPFPHATAAPSTRAHRGISLVAQRFARDVAPLLSELRARGFRPLLTGHSYGGGVSAVSAYLLRPAFPRLTAVCLASPRVLPLDVCVAMRPYTFSFVFETDIIPRLSLCTLHNLFVEAKARRDHAPPARLDAAHPAATFVPGRVYQIAFADADTHSFFEADAALRGDGADPIESFRWRPGHFYGLTVYDVSDDMHADGIIQHEFSFTSHEVTNYMRAFMSLLVPPPAPVPAPIPAPMPAPMPVPIPAPVIPTVAAHDMHAGAE
eukprot:gnl/Chilomastix_cuspidata/1592.p1 GENE.gnl/Chilomastix_cuspidata/1592~~gnl/Chilomastix_cuspidata/1592.p1  ORF type:complete len:560 (-),score=238.04 gnl/Chilomastix_cuspidata/1592:869-2548(-)